MFPSDRAAASSLRISQLWSARLSSGRYRETHPNLTEGGLEDSSLKSKPSREEPVSATVYLDTSVIGSYYDPRDNLRRAQTRQFWMKLGEYSVNISKLVIDELREIADQRLRFSLLKLVSAFKVLEITPEIEALADEYVKGGVVPVLFRSDAIHLAAATVNSVNYLVSWNFKHLVNVRTRGLVNEVNLKRSYRALDIVSPQEL